MGTRVKVLVKGKEQEQREEGDEGRKPVDALIQG